MSRSRVFRISVISLAVILSLGFIYAKKDIFYDIGKNIELFTTIYKEVALNYVEPVDPSEFMRAGINGMLTSLDPYTTYIDNTNREDIDALTYGKYSGIGVSVGLRNNRVIILEVLEGFTAQRQGVKVGDIIYQVSGTKVDDKNYKSLSKLLRGENGTRLNLKVLRNGNKDTVDFNLVREDIKVKNVSFADFYPENSNNVYIKLTSFGRNSGPEIREALRSLSIKKNIETIVLDLRNNPGGLLEAAVNVCEEFLPPNTLVVTTRGRENNENSFYTKSTPLALKTKMVVLVDDGTASAAEIVAGALQDHDRAVILGVNTYGKGLVQTVVNINQDASLKMTTARYYTPSGRCIQKLDYSFIKKETKPDSKYFTDAKREVKASGGILPDTVVNSLASGNITEQLLARGIIFDFSNVFFYANNQRDLFSITRDELFSAFEEYLAKQNVQYHSDAEKEIDLLLGDVKKKNQGRDIVSELEKVKNQLQAIGKKEIKIYKNEIVNEIESELALRYLGFEQKVKYELKLDKEFNTALDILKNNKLYAKLLK